MAIEKEESETKAKSVNRGTMVATSRGQMGLFSQEHIVKPDETLQAALLRRQARQDKKKWIADTLVKRSLLTENNDENEEVLKEKLMRPTA